MSDHPVIDEKNIYCVYSQAYPSRRCDSAIGSQDLQHADALRQTLIASHPADPKFRRILDQYGRMYLCKQHRTQIDVHHKDYWERRLDAWSETFHSHLESTNIVAPAQSSTNLVHEKASVPKLDVRRAKLSASAPVSPVNQFKTPEIISDDVARQQNFSTKTSKVASSCFKLYLPPTGTTSELLDLIKSPLSITELKSGYMYGYRRITGDADGKKHIRIGHATHKIDDSAHVWSNHCQYFLELIGPVVQVKHAARVAAIIHKELELASKRRLDVRCLMDLKRCQIVHDDWFRINTAHAQSVIEHWTSWMQVYNPYDVNGLFRQELLELTHDRRHQPTQSAFFTDSQGQLWTDNVTTTTTSNGRRSQLKASKSIPNRLNSKIDRQPRPIIPRRKTSHNLRAVASQSQQDLDTFHHLLSTSTDNSNSSSHESSSSSGGNGGGNSAVSMANTLQRPNPSTLEANTGRSSSMPPSFRSLRRRERNSSLRSSASNLQIATAAEEATNGMNSTSTFTATQTATAATTVTTHAQICEAKVITCKRQRGKSIYISASSPRKILVLQDLSRIRTERSNMSMT